ncbi:MAG: hypothetical protein J5680_05075 [Neisseriaceae bacterium]|nr:hypothetical protein [Neisseriaceae bacterium]
MIYWFSGCLKVMRRVGKFEAPCVFIQFSGSLNKKFCFRLPEMFNSNAYRHCLVG